MQALKDLQSIEPVYFASGKEILTEFLLPVLQRSSAYDRITSYFTIDALLAVAQGLDHLYSHGGRMRLAVGIHDFPKDAALAVASSDTMAERIHRLRSALVKGIASLSDALYKDRLATLALMIQDGFLQVKAIDTASGQGIFHSKVLIMRDDAGDAVAAMGSLNETASGLGSNVENLVVLRSWVEGAGVRKQSEIFEQAWMGTHPDVIVADLTKELAQDIVSGLGPSYIAHIRLKLTMQADLRDSLRMPSYFFVSGAIPALYQHQERAVIDGLSRWPIRVLYADEVGLGKTFEVAATLTYLIRFCGARRAVILTPKSVLAQWQEELHDNFGIDAWLYDSSAHAFNSPTGEHKPISGECPLGKDAPNITLFSVQFARGSSTQADIFNRPGAQLPDILAVDEAHAARISVDIGGKTSATRLHRVLASVAPHIPHVILATATPMQKDAVEYHALLKLLGLPSSWEREKAFQLSLSVLGSSEPPSLSDLGQAVRLLLQVIDEMRPSLSSLNKDELVFLRKLMQADDVTTLGGIARANWPAFHTLFVKMHPAHLLTVRNTRRALEDVGYVFPKRQLIAKTLYGHPVIAEFYDKVNRYIGSTYLGVEKVLYPTRMMRDGFVKSSYQQRIASSLYSCGKSLERRYNKLVNLRSLVQQNGQAHWHIDTDLDDVDEDEALFSGKEQEEIAETLETVDASQVLLALNTEIADVFPLMKQVKAIRDASGDPKVDASIDTALTYLKAGNQILIFSRYTDTVEALIARWRSVAPEGVTFGVYTGAGAYLVRDNVPRSTTKEEIKNLLNRHELNVMFCSDAASEGLNLQAARVLINVDVPWTPARLEQRIGRVARLGQKAAAVEIVNVWFPYSVEQRMYSRINKRLSEYNLAVGEFPEVVADTIKTAILEDTVDNSAAQLQEIRNKLQLEALHSLWYRSNDQLTASQFFREQLLEILSNTPGAQQIDADTVSVTLSNDAHETLTSKEGSEDTICLTSDSLLSHNPFLQGFKTVCDEDGNPCAFVQDGRALDPEKLPLVLNGLSQEWGLGNDARPRWLPNQNNLSLQFACDREMRLPHSWPPCLGESS